MGHFKPLAWGGQHLLQTGWAGAMAVLAITALPFATTPARAQMQPEAESLTYGVWQLEMARYPNGDAVEIDEPSKYTLEFTNDGRLTLRADCNVGGGRYARSNDRLTLQMGRLTRAACPPDSWADNYLRDLAKVASYRLESGQLYLDLNNGEGTLVFAPLQLPSELLVGPVWSLSEAVYPDHSLTVTATGRYTLEFNNADGVAVRADCNRSTGTYAQSGNELSLTLGPTTLAACPPQSLSDRYLRELGQIANYRIEDGRLAIELRNNLGTLFFEPIAE